MALSNLFRAHEGNSLIYRLDPRTKLVLVMLSSVMSLLLNSPLALLALFLLTLGCHLSARVPFSKTKYLYLSYPSVFLAIACTQGFFYWGPQLTPVFTLIASDGKLLGFQLPFLSPLLARVPGELIFYWEGFVYGSIQSLRTLTLLTAGLTLALTTHPIDILFGLRRFKLPYELCFIVSMSIRFLPQIMDEIRENFRAQRARGFLLKECPLKDKLKAGARILDTLFVRWIQGARDMALAIDLRAFRALPHRTFVHERRAGKADALTLLASLIILGALILGERMW